MRRRNWIGAAVAFVLAATAVAGQDPMPPVAPPPRPVVQDPTRPSGKLKDALAVPPGGPGGARAVARIPAMILKARVIATGRPAAAVIEIDGQPRTVVAGTTVAAGDGVLLKIVEVSGAAVRIEVLPLKEVIVLN